MVIKEGKTRMRDVKKGLDILPRDKFLGYVMNNQKNGGSRYYY
jgi:hypothetical protein